MIDLYALVFCVFARALFISRSTCVVPLSLKCLSRVLARSSRFCFCFCVMSWCAEGGWLFAFVCSLSMYSYVDDVMCDGCVVVLFESVFVWVDEIAEDELCNVPFLHESLFVVSFVSAGSKSCFSSIPSSCCELISALMSCVFTDCGSVFSLLNKSDELCVPGSV